MKKNVAKSRLSVAEAFKNTLLLIRFKQKPKSKTEVVAYQVAQMVQITLILIQADPDVPFSKDYLGGIWDSLAFVARPDTILEFFNVNGLYSCYFFLPFFCMILLTYIKLVNNLRRIDLSELRDNIDAQILPKTLKVRYQLSYCITKLLFIPITFCLITHIQALLQGKVPLNIYLDVLLFTPCVLIHTGNFMLEHIYLVHINWYDKTKDTISNPKYKLIKYLIIVLFLVQVRIFPYAEMTNSKILATLGLGAGLYATFTYRLPYHFLILNTIESMKGVNMMALALVAGVCKVLGLSQASLMPAMVLFCVLPVLFFLLKNFHEKAYKKVSRAYHASSVEEVELILRYYIQKFKHSEMSESAVERVDSVLKPAVEEFCKEQCIFLWLIYYFQNSESDKEYLKYLMSQLLKLPGTFLLSAEVLFCRIKTEIYLMNNEEDEELAKFVTLERKLKRTMKIDQDICYKVVEVMEGKERNSINFDSFVRKIQEISYETKLCKMAYKRLLKLDAIKFCPFIFEYYFSYLRSIENSEKINKYYTRFKQAEDYLNQKRAGGDDLLYFDNQNLFLRVSLERKSLGKVVEVKNAYLLKFTNDELMDRDSIDIVPDPFKKNHEVWYRRINEYRHKHPLYRGIHSITLLNRYGFIENLNWKVRMHCDRLGNLTLFVKLKPTELAVDLAFIHPETWEICSFTYGFYMFLRKELGITQGGLNLFKMYNKLEEWIDDFEVVRSEIPETKEVISVRTETFLIYGVYPIKTLVLVTQSYEGEWVNALYLNYLENQGSCLSPQASCPKILFKSIDFRAENGLFNTRPREFKLNNLTFDTKIETKEQNTLAISSIADGDQKSKFRGEETTVTKDFNYLVTSSILSSIAKKVCLVKSMIFLIVFLLLSINITQYFLLSGNLSELEGNLAKLDSKIRISTLDTANLARDLQLVCEGTLSSDESSIRNNLEATAQAFELDAYDKLPTQGDISFTWIEYENGKFSEQKVNFLNLNRKVMRNAHSLSLSKCSEINQNQTHFTNLYRNCPVEVLKQVNATFLPYLKTMKNQNKQVMEFTLNLILVIASLTLASVAGFIIYFVLSLESTRKKLWKRFEMIPLESFSIGKKAAVDRLLNIHGKDNIVGNQVYGTEKWKYKTHSSFKWFLLFTGFLFGLQVLSTGLYYEFCYTPIEEIILKAPVNTNAEGLIITGVKSTSFWTREFALSNTSNAYHKTISSLNSIVNTKAALEESLEEFNYWSDYLIRNNKVIRSQEKASKLFSVFFREACYSEPCNNRLKKGLLSALIDYEQYALDLVERIQQGSTYYDMHEEFDLLKSLEDQISTAMYSFKDFYEEFISSENTYRFELMIYLMASMFSVQALLYLLFIRTLLNKMKQIMNSEIWFISILPNVNFRLFYRELSKKQTMQ